MTKKLIWAIIAGALLASTAGPVNAAPVGPSTLVDASEESGTTQVRHRCYRHRGHWHCPRHSRYYRYYDRPYHGYYRPYYRPHYYGHGPGFGIYFGGRRGWW